MRKNIKTVLLFGAAFSFGFANAQLEVAHLSTKGYSSFGAGGFFSFGTLVARDEVITFETNAMVFQHAVTTASVMGCRRTFNGKADGLYIEPQFAYTFGGANIPKRDSSEYPSLYSKGYINQPNLSGFTAILMVGYIFPGKFAFNLGLRYQHIVSGNPQADLVSLRLSHAIIYNRNKY